MVTDEQKALRRRNLLTALILGLVAFAGFVGMILRNLQSQ